jgi:hypothetical protein
MALTDRLSQLPQVAPTKQRLVADLPANVQLNGIAQILAGQNSNNPSLNTFVKQAAAQGMQPEQIRQAFIAEQKKSTNPLVILG